MKKRILTVDNASFINRIYKFTLAHNDYDVVAQAVNGKEAVEKFFVIRPDLVILDITMPVMDGKDALREIKKIDPDARVIMSTSEARPKEVLECLAYGAYGYIIKPFQQETLLETVETILNEAPVFNINTIMQYIDHKKVEYARKNNINLSQEGIKKLLELCKGEYTNDPLDFMEDITI